jgi:hypothetical protein
MKEIKPAIKAEVVAQMVMPITLEIELERPTEYENRCRVEIVQCHYYSFAGDGSVDLFQVEYGRLVRKTMYAGVLGIREIDSDGAALS